VYLYVYVYVCVYVRACLFACVCFCVYVQSIVKHQHTSKSVTMEVEQENF